MILGSFNQKQNKKRVLIQIYIEKFNIKYTFQVDNLYIIRPNGASDTSGSSETITLVPIII